MRTLHHEPVKRVRDNGLQQAIRLLVLLCFFKVQVRQSSTSSLCTPAARPPRKMLTAVFTLYTLTNTTQQSSVTDWS